MFRAKNPLALFKEEEDMIKVRVKYPKDGVKYGKICESIIFDSDGNLSIRQLLFASEKSPYTACFGGVAIEEFTDRKGNSFIKKYKY